MSFGKPKPKPADPWFDFIGGPADGLHVQIEQQYASMRMVVPYASEGGEVFEAQYEREGQNKYLYAPPMWA